jgi:glycosyltransferase involved in cell wall biosynthesis
MSGDNPLVSVIIPTKNEENYIRDVLLSIKKQSYKKIEIVVVDSSNDKTVSVARKFTNKIIRKQANIPQAKNLGANNARGEILIFIDADTCLLPSWVEKGLEYLVNENYDAVIGNVSTRENDFRAFLVGGIYRSFLELTGLINAFSMGGLPLMITRKFFEKTGGFSEELVSCEDIEFIKRIKKEGRVKVDKTILSLISMRRFEKNGYIKEILEAGKSGIYFLLKNKSYHTDNYPIFR